MGTSFQTGFGTGDTGGGAGRSAAESALGKLDGDSADFAVVFLSPTYDTAEVIEGVRAVLDGAQLVGATSAGEFTGEGIHTSFFTGREGVTVAAIASDELRFYTALCRNVSRGPEEAISEAASRLPDEVDGYPHLSGLLLSSSGWGLEETLLVTYQQIPIKWAGGGASDPHFKNMVVSAGGEVASDALALTVIASKRPAGMGIGNSHEPIENGPYEVTRAEGNVVYELDGEPAYDVWKRAFVDTVEERYGFTMEQIQTEPQLMYMAFSELVFGLRAANDEYKMRNALLTLLHEPPAGIDLPGSDLDPPEPFGDLPTLGKREPGALYFTDPVVEGMVFYPLASGPRHKVDRGKIGVERALDDLEGGSPAGGFIFDCPCGELVLQEDYNQLTDTISRLVDAPIAGIQSGGGEICMRPGDMRGLHGGSSSVLLFPGGEGE